MSYQWKPGEAATVMSRGMSASARVKPASDRRKRCPGGCGNYAPTAPGTCLECEDDAFWSGRQA